MSQSPTPRADKKEHESAAAQLKALAFLGFLINLFNLLPVIPLDGGRIAAALHPALWFAGLLALLALVIYRPNPILIIILLLAGSELRRRWQTRRAPQMQDYYRVRPQQRLLIGVLYFGLAAALAIGMHATQVPHRFSPICGSVVSSRKSSTSEELSAISS